MKQTIIEQFKNTPLIDFQNTIHFFERSVIRRTKKRTLYYKILIALLSNIAINGNQISTSLNF